MHFYTKNDKLHRQRRKAQRKIEKLCNKRDKLDKNSHWEYDYTNKRKKLNRKIAGAISDRNLAESEIRHPKPVPHTVIDNSNRVFAPKFGVKINSDNSAKANISAHYHSNRNRKKRTYKKSNKRSKINVKLIVSIVLALIIVGCVAGFTVFCTLKLISCFNN